MIICEVGLNHMGDVNYANEYVAKIIKAKPDGVLFHIREKEFYEKKETSKFELPDSFYIKTSKKLKKNNIKFGITLANTEKIEFCKKIDVDFYKIFGRDILDFELIKKIKKIKKKIFVSTGMSNMNEINKLIKFIKKSKQFTIIHTQLDYDISKVNFQAIPLLKKKFKMDIAYGNHCDMLNVIYLALCYNPSDLIFYVKGSRSKHVDEPHAYDLDYIPNLIKDLRILPDSIGKPIKIKMTSDDVTVTYT